MSYLSYVVETNGENGVHVFYDALEYTPQNIVWDETNTIPPGEDLPDPELADSQDYVRRMENDAYVYYLRSVYMPSKSATFSLYVFYNNAPIQYTYEVYTSFLTFFKQGDALLIKSSTNLSGNKRNGIITIISNLNGEKTFIPVVQDYTPIRLRLVSYEYENSDASSNGTLNDVNYTHTFHWLTEKNAPEKEALEIGVLPSGPRNGYIIREVREFVRYGDLDSSCAFSSETGTYYKSIVSSIGEKLVIVDEDVVFDVRTEGVYRETKYKADLKIIRDGNMVKITNYGRCFLQDDAYYVIILSNVDDLQETATIVIRYVDDETPTTEEEPITDNFLTFTANENGSSVGFYCDGDIDTGKNMQYSTDGGATWYDYTIGIGSGNVVPITLEEGESVKFRGENENLAYFIDERNYRTIRCTIGGSVAASGDVTSLLNGVGGDVAVPQRCYNLMFHDCTSLTTAPELPATTLANNCYNGMFYNCTGLTSAPALPATQLAGWCYDFMFYGCTTLTTAPELPATTLAEGCYRSMFSGCTSLTTALALPATELANYCYDYMFQDCTSLTTAPELPATRLAYNCYEYMFEGCTSLSTAPELPATTLAQRCYGGMFWKCISLTQAPVLPATMLAEGCYQSMFQSCTSLATAPALTATTLAANCYQNMFSGCSGLTSAPALPAITLAQSCYASMFQGCTGLSTAPELPATTLAQSCYDRMFYRCTGIMRHEIATLNNSVTVFYNNTSCVSLTIHAVTPPAIAGTTITGLKGDCIIYVPNASVAAYKTAPYWSVRSGYIQAIS